MKISFKIFIGLFLLFFGLFTQKGNVEALTYCNEGASYSWTQVDYRCEYSPVQNKDVCVRSTFTGSGTCIRYGSSCIYYYVTPETCTDIEGCIISGGQTDPRSCWVTVPDPVSPTPTLPTGCTCGDCNQCAAPGTYPDSCGNAGACACCGGGSTCPACCSDWACNNHRSDLDGLCSSGQWCCDSCKDPTWPASGSLRVWVFYDSNKNDQFDSGDQVLPEIVRTSNARLNIHLTSYPNSNVHDLQLDNGLSGVWKSVKGPNIESNCNGNGDQWNGCGGSNEVCCTTYVNYSPSFFRSCWGRCDHLGTDKVYTADDGWGNDTLRAGDAFFQWHPFWGYYYSGLSRLVSFDWSGYVGPAGSERNSINFEVRDLPSQYKVSLIRSQDPRDINDSGNRTVFDTNSLIGGSIRSAGFNYVATQLVVIGIQDTDPPPNRSPGLSDLTISNSLNLNVAPVDGRNHICQDEFTPPATRRRVNFIVSVSDLDGYQDVEDIRIRFQFGGSRYWEAIASNLNTSPSYNMQWLNPVADSNKASFYQTPYLSYGGVTRIVTFPVEFSTDFDDSIFNVEVQASDGEVTTAWTDAGRDFKVWDCQVPVNGSLYDAGGNSGVCTPEMYTNLVSDEVNFTNLNMGSQLMTVTSPNYVDGGNHLTWGQTYVPDFNDDLNAGSPLTSIRVTDPSDTSVDCRSGTVLIDEDNFDPYASSIEADVDFSATQNQDPWWQGRGVSVLGITRVTSDVPATCTGTCIGALTIDNTPQNDNGAVVSSSLGLSAGEWGYDSNWYRGGHTQTYLPNLTYSQMHTDLFDGKGVGREESDWNGVIGDGGTGLVFVTGPLTITSNHVVASGEFLMVVVNGTITINADVTQIDGAYLASGGQILIGGENDIALTINGMLYASGNIDITRGFITNASNNLNPAVVVDMRPDLIFNAPSYMFDNRTRL